MECSFSPIKLSKRLSSLFKLASTGGREHPAGLPVEIVASHGAAFAHAEIGEAYIRCELTDLLRCERDGRLLVPSKVFLKALTSYEKLATARLVLQHGTYWIIGEDDDRIELMLAENAKPPAQEPRSKHSSTRIVLNRLELLSAGTVVRAMSRHDNSFRYVTWALKRKNGRLVAVAGRGNYFEILELRCSSRQPDADTPHRLEFTLNQGLLLQKFLQQSRVPTVEIWSETSSRSSHARHAQIQVNTEFECIKFKRAFADNLPTVRLTRLLKKDCVILRSCSDAWLKPLGGVLAAVKTTLVTSRLPPTVSVFADPSLSFIEIEFQGSNRASRRIPLTFQEWPDVAPANGIRFRLLASSLNDLMPHVTGSKQIQLELSVVQPRAVVRFSSKEVQSNGRLATWHVDRLTGHRQRRTIVLGLDRCS